MGTEILTLLETANILIILFVLLRINLLEKRLGAIEQHLKTPIVSFDIDEETAKALRQVKEAKDLIPSG